MLDIDEKVMALLANLDDDTFSHSKRTSDLSLILGQKMGLTAAELRSLKMGALLHDVGKTNVPPTVLHKTTQLNSQEWELIKQHPVYGYKLIEPYSLSDAVKNIVLEHHRWADGKGGTLPIPRNPALWCKLFLWQMWLMP